MLGRIREHLAASPPVGEGHHKRTPSPAGLFGKIPEHPTSKGLIDLFDEALRAVNGNCTIVADEAEAALSLKRLIDINKLQRIAVSDSAIVQRLMRPIEDDTEVLWNPEPKSLFDCDAGITSAQWAIAETGTLVLESKSERHRLVSLIPPMHLAIVAAGQIRQSMSDVLEAVNKENDLSRTITFITGPSRTSDIELTLAIGVHGPGKLHVIVIKDVKPAD